MQVNAGQQQLPPRVQVLPKAGALSASSSSSHFIPPPHNAIQLPMLGPNLQVQQKLQPNQPMPQQQQGPQQSEIPPPPQSGQDFTLSSVLHYLQSEWRKYERDRNEWEIERAEMRVRPLLFVVASSPCC